MSLISISPGHYGPNTGAKDIIDEGTEARKVVSRVVSLIRNAGIGVTHIVDNKSNLKSENLDYLITQHNKSVRNLDVSIHFNSTSGRHDTGIGTEILYLNDKLKSFAAKVCKAISDSSGLRNRGARKRINLAFLNNTNKPAILIETCFVNSTVDVEIYQEKFDEICIAIANQLIQFVKPGHPIIGSGPKPEPYLESEEINEPESTELKSSLDKTIPKDLFTGPTLIQKLEDILTNEELIRSIIDKGIEEEAIQSIWLEKLENGTLTTSDLLGLCTLIAVNQLK